MAVPEKETRVVSLRRRILRSFLGNKGGVVGLVLLAVVVASAVFAPQLAPHDPLDQDLRNRLAPPAWAEGGSWDYVVGTDHLGRDQLSRLIYGARISLTLAFISTTSSLIIGTTLGIISGYRRGALDLVIMRFADIQLSMPFYVIAIAVVAVLGPSFRNLVIVMSLWGWTFYGRIARGEVLAAREKDYVESARVIGARGGRIMFTHILPNIISPLIVIWTFSIATMILAESGLSFLGLGVQPPTPSWGIMLSNGQRHIATAWWLSTFPGLALMITILAINLVGDTLRDALDPRTWR
jgi:ABC-type dipeptide/oligopeptide/nickel transport system permease subunit